MLTDDRDERAGPDPRAGGRGRIEIINRAAGRIDPVERIARGAVGALRDRLIELPVADARKGPALIDDAGERVRERRMLNTVEHNSTNGHLPGIRLTTRLRRDQAREQIDLRAGCTTGAAGIAAITATARRQPHGCQRLGAGLSIDREAVFLLEGAHSALCSAAVDTIHAASIITPAFELRLDLRDHSAAGALFIRGRLDGWGKRVERHAHQEQHRERETQTFGSFLHIQNSFADVWF